jgi:hypothetical protein
MVKNKVAQLILAFLLLSLPLFGQYTATYSESAVDVLNSTYSPYSSLNCASSSCWFGMGTDKFSQLTASYDANASNYGLQAIDSSGHRWYWKIATQSWVEISDTYTWAAMHVGSYANNYYLGITTGGGAYYWNGSSWSSIISGITVIDGAVTSNGLYYVLGQAGNVHSCTASSCTQIYSGGNGATIAANALGALLLVTTSGTLYAYDGSNWNEVTGLGFTPSTAVGSVAIGDDNSISIIGSESNVRVSHDGGNTWTEVDHFGMTPAGVANGSMASSFVLDSSGYVWHLNTILPTVTDVITGSCGSACGSGDNVTVQFQDGTDGYPQAQFTCPSGWSYGGGEWPYNCYETVPATTNLNATLSSSFTNCDSFAPGTSCQSVVPVIATVLDLALDAFVLNQQNDCACVPAAGWINQKYKITSATNVAAVPDKLFALFDIPEAYTWTNASVQQWCVGTYTPNLTGTVIIDYLNVTGGVPSSMPGQYINADIPVIVFEDGTVSGLPAYTTLANWKTGGQAGSIYTWDGTSSKRGAGGSPTKVCGGNLSQ